MRIFLICEGRAYCLLSWRRELHYWPHVDWIFSAFELRHVCHFGPSYHVHCLTRFQCHQYYINGPFFVATHSFSPPEFVSPQGGSSCCHGVDSNIAGFRCQYCHTHRTTWSRARLALFDKLRIRRELLLL